MNANNLINQQVLNLIGKRLGFKNGIPQQFVNLATTLLMSGMANKMNNKETAEDAFGFFKNQSKEGNQGGILDNILDFVKGAIGGKETPEANNQDAEQQGSLNLEQLFGEKLDGIVTAFAQATGLEKQKAKQLLLILAPIVLAYVVNKIQQKPDTTKEEFTKEVNEDYREPERTVRTESDGGILETLLNRKDDNAMRDAVGILRTLLFK